MKITQFRGDYRFLSNFYPCRILYEGMTYLSTESAYQAAKTLDKKERLRFMDMSPGEAKREGRKLDVRKDWEEVKLQVMKDVLQLKFFGNKSLAQKLLDTGNAELIEGNTWGDTFYGVCNGIGENHLGKLLMKVRDELKVLSIFSFPKETK